MSVNVMNSLEDVVKDSAAALMAKQRSDGHWVFQLEADATIPAEYVLYLHYLDERDSGKRKKFSRNQVERLERAYYELLHSADLLLFHDGHGA